MVEPTMPAKKLGLRIVGPGACVAAVGDILDTRTDVARRNIPQDTPPNITTEPEIKFSFVSSTASRNRTRLELSFPKLLRLSRLDEN